MTIIQNANEPLIIALDVTGSMCIADAPASQEPPELRTRFAYAVARVDDLLSRLPDTTEVTLVTVGACVTELCERAKPEDARAQLLDLVAADATCHTGMLLERCMMQYLRGTERGTLLLITDGMPSDGMRYEAWKHYSQAHNNRLAIHVLTLGHADDPVGDRLFYVGENERHSYAALRDTELMYGRPATHPPDGSDPAIAPTQPPSVAPPTPHARERKSTEYVSAAKHAPATPAAPATRTPTSASNAPKRGGK